MQDSVLIAIAAGDGVSQIGRVVATQRHTHEIIEAGAFESPIERHLRYNHIFYKRDLVVNGVLTAGQRFFGLWQHVVGISLGFAGTTGVDAEGIVMEEKLVAERSQGSGLLAL